MKTSAFTCILLLIALWSCTNKDTDDGLSHCGDPFTANITSSDLQNCKYKPGTYWVMLDSVNMNVDSIYIESIQQGYLQDACQNKYEIHSFTTLSANSSESTNYVVAAGGLFRDFEGTPNTGTLIYGDYATVSSMDNFLVKRLDSLLVYGQTYMNVLRIEIENDPTENHKRSVYFINSDYGFLKQEIYTINTLISNKILIRKRIIR